MQKTVIKSAFTEVIADLLKLWTDVVKKGKGKNNQITKIKEQKKLI